MIVRLVFALACVAAFGAPALAQQQPEPIELAAQPKAGERADLDLQSIRRYGETQGRFEVVVAWADPGAPRPAGLGQRRVRYMANCEDGTITLAAVGVFDDVGNVAKTMIAPPGSIDPVKPEKGTEQAKWLRRVCMF
jgi:hypothetical protein